MGYSYFLSIIADHASVIKSVEMHSDRQPRRLSHMESVSSLGAVPFGDSVRPLILYLALTLRLRSGQARANEWRRFATEAGCPHMRTRRTHILLASVVEAIAKLYIQLPGVVPVKPAKCEAVIELHAAVGHVQGIQGNGVFFGE